MVFVHAFFERRSKKIVVKKIVKRAECFRSGGFSIQGSFFSLNSEFFGENGVFQVC